ncbi:uncharacterized protein LOC130053578 [Ostrea edulis]|uniref:uncharacterized protein LOC130053578 n=1 Tax=Ostrea edulis TaxID=37623 RepID=UPI0024AF1017|nr:uncharacterized protein LOC130053578 [Ostrea edulis]
MEDWKRALDENKYVAAILMDLSKAFDCLPHDLLLLKLEHYGLGNEALSLLESYLSERYQNVKIGEFLRCFSSIPTLSVVSVCPKNRKEWIAASDRKHCSCILQNCTRSGNFQYHCLVNTNADGLVEVCLPVRRIVGQYCSFYDDKKIRAENHYHLPCKEHDVVCPEFYQSNEAYKYQECYKTVTTGDTSTEESPSGQMDDNQIEIQLDTSGR